MIWEANLMFLLQLYGQVHACFLWNRKCIILLCGLQTLCFMTYVDRPCWEGFKEVGRVGIVH